MKKWIFYLLLCSTNLALGQNTFFKVYDLYDQNRSVDLIQTLDGHFMLHGTRLTSIANHDGMLFSKISSQGNYMFHKVYDTTNNIDYGQKVIACADSGFLLVGTSKSFVSQNNYDIWVVKTDKTGAWQWSKTIDGGSFTPDIGQNAIQLSNGTFIISGVIDYNTSALSGDSYLINLSATGSILWKKKLTYSNNQEAKYLLKGNNGFYVAGFNGVYGTANNVSTLTRMDFNGNVVWQKTYSILSNTTIQGITLTSDEGCLATTNKSIFKVDSLGTLVWARSYTSSNFYSLSNTYQLPDQSYAAVGNYSPGGTASGVLYKFDSSFNIDWIKSYGPNFVGNGDMIVLPNNQGYVFAGIGTPVIGGLNPTCAIIKTDSLGIAPCDYIDVLPQNLTIASVTGNTINNVPSSTSVGYIFAQYSLQQPSTNLNHASRCVTVATTAIDQQEVDIYPNPFTNKVTFSFVTQSPRNIRISDAIGRIILSASCNGNHFIFDSNGIHEEMLFYAITDIKTGVKHTGKIMSAH